MRSSQSGFRNHAIGPAVLASCVLVIAGLLVAAPKASATVVRQESFASADEAASALAQAVRSGDLKRLLSLFGPEGKSLVSSGDKVADAQARERFTAHYDEGHQLELQGDTKAVLVIGKDAWPFAIPIVKAKDRWMFDTKAGATEIVNRRIGRNELSAVQVSLAYVDAQREYASKDEVGDGVLAYASKFASSPGKHDGLYWPQKEGEPESPLGPLVAQARVEGYAGDGKKTGERTPYHGYYYKILTGQGEHAAGGAYDYSAHHRLLGGFGLVAFPARYGVSGVMTFIVNQDGVVYQKDLGPKTAQIAVRMTRFDPDETWTKQS